MSCYAFYNPPKKAGSFITSITVHVTKVFTCEQNHVTPYCRTTTKRVSRRCLLHTRERSEILRSYYATRIEYSHLIDLIAKLGSDYLVEQIDIETASKYMYDKINVVQKASNYIIIYSQINCEDIA